MRRLQFVAQLGVSLLIVAPAYPQSVKPDIGFMSTRSANDSTRVVAAFVKGLRDTGFDEGRNVGIEYSLQRARWIAFLKSPTIL
jgi:putative ABC transport system substrate-binding protein